MGAGERAREPDIALAERLGELIAGEQWVLLTGGRDAGVMAAAVRGAKRVAGSLTVGILPTESGAAAPGLDIPIYTGTGEARNVINVLSSRVVITCGHLNAGTTTEAAFALKLGRPLILLAPNKEAEQFFRSLDANVRVASSPEEAIQYARRSLSDTGGR
jgi:uncharacterized protein (TIGR00725 family)